MARITLKNLRHSYDDPASRSLDYALKDINLEWDDGGAYALLGPSGCGKTTLLNIISGLLTPTSGSILFDGVDVTALSPEERNIAQVFQFPVIYDTMTVRQNLAFPLINRGVNPTHVAERVKNIAGLLEITDLLNTPAMHLSPDDKQKISLGRGLIREDVKVVMFDEPLTVIDPHLKWRLRSKLKELHQRTRTTMIYVTHDQTEALTFADSVVVMQNGNVVQIGTPVELFERPEHTFVGYFIGSPGMNILPCDLKDGQVFFGGSAVQLNGKLSISGEQRFELGIRPEFVEISTSGIPARVLNTTDMGRYTVVEARTKGDILVRAIVRESPPTPGMDTYLNFPLKHTHLYANGWLASR